MITIASKILELICLFLRLSRRGGTAGLVAEVILLRQQLLVLTRGKKKSPPLTTFDRVVMALCAFKMTPSRIAKASIAIASSTLLDFHRALINKKYSRLFSRKSLAKPGPKGPSKELIQLVVETKEKNPTYGCPKMRCLSPTSLESR